MKKLLIFTVLVLLSLTINAQDNSPTYKLGVNNELVKEKSATTVDTKTQYTVVIKEVVYPVYLTARGKYYILRTSKKTGKEYKQYLKVEL